MSRGVPLPKGACGGQIKHVFCGPTGKRVDQGLEYYLDESQIRTMFSKYGEVTDIQIRSNAKDVFAFVHFTDSHAAWRAIQDLKGWQVHEGVRTKVSWGSYNARNRPQQDGSQMNNLNNPKSNHNQLQDANVPNHVSYPLQQRQVNNPNPALSYNRPQLDRNNSYATNNQKSYTRSRSNRSRSRSRSEERKDSSYRLTIENLPPQMKKDDLREIGRYYGGPDSVRSSKTWVQQHCTIGRLEFYSTQAQVTTYSSLKGHRINGLKIRLYCD